MWVYEKALQFNVDIKNKDARMAKHIIAQYGGPFCIWRMCDKKSVNTSLL